jgi:hypothetical protein
MGHTWLFIENGTLKMTNPFSTSFCIVSCQDDDPLILFGVIIVALFTKIWIFYSWVNLFSKIQVGTHDELMICFQ